MNRRMLFAALVIAALPGTAFAEPDLSGPLCPAPDPRSSEAVSAERQAGQARAGEQQPAAATLSADQLNALRIGTEDSRF